MSEGTADEESKDLSKENPCIKFNPKKGKRQLRQRRVSDDDEDEEVSNDAEGDHLDFNRDKLQETLELQKLRQRSNGISHVTLASGKKLNKIEEIVAADSDPFKIQTGGLLTLSSAKAARAMEDPDSSSGRADGLGLGGPDGVVGTQFSKETRVRDEDEEMRKFIEAEMEKRRRGRQDGEDSSLGGRKYLSPEDRALMSLPDHLRKSTFTKNEEMLSSQMLSGIPEVDLGIEEKIRNIEATEEAKKKLAEQEKKCERPSEFVPTNLAVNFKQPNRFKADILDAADDGRPQEKKPRGQAEVPVVATQRTVVVGEVPRESVILVGGGQSEQGGDAKKATDDLHLTKFKQHFHRK